MIERGLGQGPVMPGGEDGAAAGFDVQRVGGAVGPVLHVADGAGALAEALDRPAVGGQAPAQRVGLSLLQQAAEKAELAGQDAVVVAEEDDVVAGDLPHPVLEILAHGNAGAGLDVFQARIAVGGDDGGGVVGAFVVGDDDLDIGVVDGKRGGKRLAEIQGAFARRDDDADLHL